jgi:hypothetical protein
MLFENEKSQIRPDLALFASAYRLEYGSSGRIRTGDLSINSRMLYR